MIATDGLSKSLASNSFTIPSDDGSFLANANANANASLLRWAVTHGENHGGSVTVGKAAQRAASPKSQISSPKSY